MDEDSVNIVYQALVLYGLTMNYNDISKKEAGDQKHVIRTLLKDNKPSTLVEAIKYGMPNVWPFTEGRAFDARDLRDNLLKAKAEAGARRRSGSIPTQIRTQEEE